MEASQEITPGIAGLSRSTSATTLLVLSMMSAYPKMPGEIADELGLTATAVVSAIYRLRTMHGWPIRFGYNMRRHGYMLTRHQLSRAVVALGDDF